MPAFPSVAVYSVECRRHVASLLSALLLPAVEPARASGGVGRLAADGGATDLAGGASGIARRGGHRSALCPVRPPPATVFRGQRGADGLAGHGNAGDLAVAGLSRPGGARRCPARWARGYRSRPQPDPSRAALVAVLRSLPAGFPAGGGEARWQRQRRIGATGARYPGCRAGRQFGSRLPQQHL